MNLAGYIRVSTEGQVDAYGKDVQHDGIARWADLNGHTVTEWFEEDAVSGTVDGGDRPVLADILLRAVEFDGIVFFDPTRIARRSLIQEQLLALVWKNGLTVFTTTAGEMQADEDDPTRILLRQFMGILAEFDHRSTVKKLQAARLVKSSRGGYIGGVPKFGQKTNGQFGKYAELVEDEVECEVIEMIRTHRANGLGLRDIAKRLNAGNVPTKTGKTWHASQVTRILQRYNAASQVQG